MLHRHRLCSNGVLFLSYINREHNSYIPTMLNTRKSYPPLKNRHKKKLCDWYRKPLKKWN